MYLQIGDERQWLRQQRRSMELAAGRRPAPPATADARWRTAAEFRNNFGEVVRKAAGRAVSLMRSSLAGLGNLRPGAA